MQAHDLAVALRLSDPPAVQHMRTICEVLRELGRHCDGDVAALTLILEATEMAKRMQRKLVAYHEDERAAL